MERLLCDLPMIRHSHELMMLRGLAADLQVSLSVFSDKVDKFDAMSSTCGTAMSIYIHVTRLNICVGYLLLICYSVVCVTNMQRADVMLVDPNSPSKPTAPTAPTAALERVEARAKTDGQQPVVMSSSDDEDTLRVAHFGRSKDRQRALLGSRSPCAQLHHLTEYAMITNVLR